MPTTAHTPPTGGDDRKLPTFLCFAIYSANLAFGRAYKPLLDALGLTYTQYIALVALADENGPDRRRAGREAVPGVQHPDAHPQEDGDDGLRRTAA